MGLGNVLKRLFRAIFSREKTFPCTCCGAKIRQSDFDEGRAAIVARVRYCPTCVQLVIGRSAPTLKVDTSSSSFHAPLPG